MNTKPMTSAKGAGSSADWVNRRSGLNLVPMQLLSCFN